jgi:Cys-rich repeat protein
MKMAPVKKRAGVCAAIICILLAAPGVSRAADDPFAADSQMMQDGLAQVKAELIQNLRESGHTELADHFANVNPQKIGDFLGSAAGGDFDRAFTIAGSSAANYLNDRFQERLSQELEKYIQPGSPAAVIGQYIPWDSAQAKKIAISAFRGEFENAGSQLSHMVRTKGRENLKQASKDIIAYGIDWVLQPTVGLGAGQLFIKAVEYEIEGIKWFEKWSAEYLTEKRRKQYTRYRKQGMAPKAAVHKINSDSGFTAFSRYPFHDDEKDALEYLETHYAKNEKKITEAKLKNNTAAQARNVAEALAADLYKQQEKHDKELKQELLAIFLKAAEGNEELKILLTGLKAAREKIEQIEEQTRQLDAFMRKNKKVFDAERMEERKQAIRDQLTGLESAAQASELEKCGRIPTWQTEISENLDGAAQNLERIRELGKESRELAGKVCENKEDRALVEEGMLALKKRFGLVGAKRRQARTRMEAAISAMKSLAALQDEVKTLLKKEREIESALHQIEKWDRLLRAGQHNIDTPAETVNKLYAEIRQTIDQPAFDRFIGESGSIRYTILGDAAEAKAAFDEQKTEVETAFKKLAESISGVDTLKEKLAEKERMLGQALGECATLRDLDLSHEKGRIREMQEKDERYLKAFRKLKEKAFTCAGGQDGQLSAKALEEARKWLDKARERGGTVIDKFTEADAAKTRLAQTAASLQSILSKASTPATSAPDLIAACSAARQESRKIQGEIEAATAASAGQLATLKKTYAAAADASKGACKNAKSASSAKDPDHCKNAAARAMALAGTAREAAEKADAAAKEMKALYAGLRSKTQLQSFDELLRKIPSAIEALKEQIAGGNDLLSEVDAAAIEKERETARTAAEAADAAAGKVLDIVGVIRGLLSGLDPALAAEAEKIQGEAENVREIAARRSKLAAEAAASAEKLGGEAASRLSEAKAKIKALSALLAKLEDCRNTDLGGSLNELRTNSDVGEIFGPAARKEAADAFICAQGAAEICKSIKPAGCRSDDECPPGYVCERGKCVSPFDDTYDAYTDTMTQRDEDRSQDRADQVAADQKPGGGGGFTSDDLSRDLADARDAVSGKCRHDSQCPPGYVCRDGACIKKSGCAGPADCPPGHSCEDGRCVKKGECKTNRDCPDGRVCKNGKCVVKKPSRPAGLAISPANKAVVLNETVNFKAVYTDTDGTTKNVTAEAEWNPAPSLTKSEIGVYPVTAAYKGLTASAEVTVVKEKGMEDITVNQKTVTVTFWDSGNYEDGDMIDILINGEVVFPGITLTFAKQSRTITMNADIIVVGFKALNEGESPPNTASVTFSSVVDGKETQKYSLKKSQKANMNVTYKP